MKKYDAIIIGAGIGGLTAGAKLAKEGKRILIIEQSKNIGGYAATFKRKDAFIEASLHELDGLDSADPKNRIFEDLRITQNIRFVRLPEFYRFVSGQTDLIIPDDFEKAITYLIKIFPEEEKGIRKFFYIILAIRNEILSRHQDKPNTFKYFNVSLGAFLDQIIKKDILKIALQANIQFYHDDPYSLPLINFALTQGSYLTGGSYYIWGGSASLSNYLGQIINQHGGEIKLNCSVERIITAQGKATGVICNYRDNRIKNVLKFYSKDIIANLNMPHVFDKLLPRSNKITSRHVLDKIQNSISLSSIYFIFDKDLSLNNPAYSTYFYNEKVLKQKNIKQYMNTDYKNRIFSFIDYGKINSGLVMTNERVATACFVDQLANWSSLSKSQYVNKKKEVESIFIDTLNAIFPGLNNHILHHELSTPLTLQRYTKNPFGSCYGFAPNLSQIRLKRISQRTSVDNLYFASAWSGPGGGFSGAMIGGYCCAEQILK